MNIATLIDTLATPANVARITTRGKRNEVYNMDLTFTAEAIHELNKLSGLSRDHFDLMLVWDSCAVRIAGTVKINRGSDGDRLILVTEDQLVTIIADGEVIDFDANGLVQFEFSARLNQFDSHGVKGTTTLDRFLRERTTVSVA